MALDDVVGVAVAGVVAVNVLNSVGNNRKRRTRQMGAASLPVGTTKLLDGNRYRAQKNYDSKRDAIAAAKRHRGRGGKARVLKRGIHGRGWTLWTRG